MAEEHRRGAHSVFAVHLHLVWATKYRKPVLVGEVATRTRDVIREVCDRMDVKIMKGHVSKDHVHLFVSVPPRVTISKLLQQLKGKSSYKLLQEFAHLRKTGVDPVFRVLDVESSYLEEYSTWQNDLTIHKNSENVRFG